MWIKFRKQEKFIEFGKKRDSGDPLYDAINSLRIAMNNLEEVKQKVEAILNSLETTLNGTRKIKK